MLETTIKMLSLDIVRDLPVLELADKYPLLVDDQETDLIASVEANGIREPLILFEDKLADGRNRLAAAIKVELDEVPVRYFVGTIEEAEELIIDLNEKRRHLLQAQRLYIADQHREIIARRSAERQSPGTNQYTERSLHDPCMDQSNREIGTTRAILAKKHNVGINALDTIQKIRRVSEETMQDPDSEGEVSTPRAIRAGTTLNKMKHGKITTTDAVKSVFGDPGQNINPDEQSKITTAKARLGKIVTDLLNDFDIFAQVLMDEGNEADQESLRLKLVRLTEFVAKMNAKYELGDFDGLLDPDENREYWSDAESDN